MAKAVDGRPSGVYLRLSVEDAALLQRLALDHGLSKVRVVSVALRHLEDDLNDRMLWQALRLAKR